MEDFLGKITCSGVVGHCLLLSLFRICAFPIASLFFYQRTPFCNIQNYRLILWSVNFEKLFHNACPSYEVIECRKTVVLPCNLMASARPSYVPRIPYMEILGRAIYQNPRKSLRSSKGLYLNSHPCDTIHSNFSLDESTSVVACNSLLNKPPT